MKIRSLSTAIGVALVATPLPSLAQTSAECHVALSQARDACAASDEYNECLRGKLPAECTHLVENVTTLERTLVIGTGIDLDVARYPGSASVLLPDDLDFSIDIIQALSRVPGVDVGNDVGRAIGQSFAIRGWGHGNEERVILMQDGVRRSANLFANQSSSFGMDGELLKEIEVVRGSSSIHHGGGAIGGVVASETKDARDFVLPGKDFGAAVNLRYDSNNARQASGAFGWSPASGPVEFLAFVKRQDRGDVKLPDKVPNGDGTFRDRNDNDERVDTAFLKAGWSPADGHKLTLSHYRYAIEAETLWNSLYHYEYDDELGPVVGERRNDDTVLRYVARPEGSQWLDLDVTAYRSKGWYERGYAFGAEHDTDLYYRNEDRRRGIAASNRMEFRTGSVRHRVLVGADYENRKEDAIYTLNGVTTDFQSMPNEYDDLGLYVQYETAWLDERLLLQLGGRYDDFDREVQGVPETYDGDRFSPRVGASFEVVPGLNLLANYSEAFRAPSPHETSSYGPLNIHYWYLPNPDLQPETSAEHEIGFSWRKHDLFTAGDAINAKVMYFDGRLKNMIDLVVDYGSESPAGSEYVQYRNVGRVDRDGIELELSYDAERWSGFLTWETLDQHDAETGEKTPWAFADKVRAGLRWRPIRDDLEFSWITTHWFKPDQNPETIQSGGQTYYYVRKPFSQTDVQVRWRPYLTGSGFLDGSTQVLFGINNVFDQKYMNAAVVETNSRIGRARNVYLSLSKQF